MLALSPQGSGLLVSQPSSNPPPFLPPFVPFSQSEISFRVPAFCAMGFCGWAVLDELYFPGCYTQLPLISKCNAFQNNFFSCFRLFNPNAEPQLALPLVPRRHVAWEVELVEGLWLDCEFLAEWRVDSNNTQQSWFFTWLLTSLTSTPPHRFHSIFL